MSNMVQPRIAPIVRWSKGQDTHRSLTLPYFMAPDGKRAPNVIWTPPTEDEWRLAIRILAKQMVMHVSGYLDEDEFARDGCRFAWDAVETFPSQSHYHHWRRTSLRRGMWTDIAWADIAPLSNPK